MSFDQNGMGARSSLSLTAGITAMTAFESLPGPLKMLLSALFLAAVNFGIEWFRLRRAEMAARREQLEKEAEPVRESAPPPLDSTRGFARFRALLFLGALFLAACGGRFFLRVFSEPTLGKCVASGYAREFPGEPDFTSYSGAVQCVSAPVLQSASEIPLTGNEPESGLASDAHEVDSD